MSGTYTGSYGTITITQPVATITATGRVVDSVAYDIAVSRPSGSATLDNYGTVLESGSHGTGIAWQGSLKNTGLFEATGTVGVAVSLVSGYLANFGRIEATGSSSIGVDLRSSTLTNQSSGLIEGTTGVILSGAATVVNSGTIESGSGDDGIVARFTGGGETLIEEAGGILVGSIAGFSDSDQIDLTQIQYSTANSVSYNSVQHEIIIYDAWQTSLTSVSVTDVGISAGEIPVLQADGQGGTSILLDTPLHGTYSGSTGPQTVRYSPAKVTVSGQITDATRYGTAFNQPFGASGTVTNYGTITEAGAHGTAVAWRGLVDNAGVVEATGASSVGIDLSTGNLLNEAGGLISGAKGILADGTVTIVNDGTIQGTDGIAVQFNGANSALILDVGSVLAGNAFGNGSDTVALAGNGTVSGLGSGTLTGTTPGVFVGFGAYQINSGGTWTLSGSNTVNLGERLIIYGNTTIADTLVNIGGIGGYVDLSGAYFVNHGGASHIGGVVRGTGSVSNDGTIDGNLGIAIEMTGGVVTNSSGGLIEGARRGIHISGAAGTIVNDGTINGASGYGIELDNGGSITNGIGALVEGLRGGIIAQSVHITIVNYGTIKAQDGYSLQLFPGDALEIQNGSTLVGYAQGNGALLEAGAEGGRGTLTGLGSGATYSGFQQYQINVGADWSLAGSNSISSDQTLTDLGSLTIAPDASLTNNGLIEVNGGVFIDDTSLSGTGMIDITNGGTVELLGSAAGTTIDFNDASVLDMADSTGVTLEDFAAGDTIDLTGLAFSSTTRVTYDAAAHEIIVYGTTNTTLDVSGVVIGAGETLGLEPDRGGTAIEVVCFLKGTRISTHRGEIPVEALSERDLVATASGDLVPVKWIGQRRMNAKRHPNPEKVYPIRIKRNAFADAVPLRDLLVSPGHAIFANGVLIPAHRLINGVTVFQDFTVDEPFYFHIELEQHGVLLAEGLSAESYLDSGNRAFFENGDRPVELFASPDRRHRAKGRCAALKNGGAEVTAVKQRLLQRVRALGHVVARRPELRLEIDGRTVLPVSVKRWTYRFELPLNYETVRLISQTAIGGSTRPGNFDTRRLGVAVLEVTYGDQAVDLHDLRDGWHRVEREGHKKFRWTDGNALLPVVGSGTLEVNLLRPAERWLRQVDLTKLRRA